jgi:hypothetical protein
MIRYYLCDVDGDGLTPATAFKPKGLSVLGNVNSSIVDGRQLATNNVGKMLFRADVTAAQHTTLIAVVGVTYIPIEDLLGNPIDVGLTLGDIPATKRTTIKTIFENENIPTQGFQLVDNIDDSMMKVAGRRFLMRQILGSDDWVELLDTLVSAIAPARRQIIRDKLQARGYDTSVIVGSDTIREAIRKLIAQR